MPEDSKTNSNKSFSFDWLISGVLTKLGDIFDTFTGRRWKPSSSLATSELTEKLKKLLEAKVRDSETAGKFVPHNIQLKMQWDKFSTDSEESLKKLENELLIAAVDFINDRRYHTYAPLNVEIKPDYFTEGVKLSAGFGDSDEADDSAAVNVTVPDLKNVLVAPDELPESETEKEIFIAKFTLKGKERETTLAFETGERKTVGRSGGNDLWLDDTNVSKIHAALMLDGNNQLVMSDTGSTNGTFLNGERIAYGKAIPVNSGDKIKFGTVEVEITHIPKEVEPEAFDAEDFTINELQDFPEKTPERTNQMKVLETISIKPEISKNEALRENEDFSSNEITEPLLQFDDESEQEEIVTETPEKPEKKEEDFRQEKDVETSSTDQRIVFDFDEK